MEYVVLPGQPGAIDLLKQKIREVEGFHGAAPEWNPAESECFETECLPLRDAIDYLAEQRAELLKRGED